MTAPTPVSALLHAATLVTAGMFLLLRSGNVLANYFQLNHIIFSIGALTALISGLTAVFQSDIKKLVAYSTTSQLGYICLGSGLGNYSAAVFHLFTHAFFKGLLFLSSALAARLVVHIISAHDHNSRVRKWIFNQPSISKVYAALYQSGPDSSRWSYSQAINP